MSPGESPEQDYTFFRDRWVPGTCAWILSNDTFNWWLEDSYGKPRVLWAQGNAASGKSVLSSFVIDHLSQLGLPVHYFFVRFTDQKKRGLGLILRSLACQMAQSLPEYADKLREVETAAPDLRTADARGIWQWLFHQTLFRTRIDNPVYCVVDGLDEADSPSSLIRLLADLQPVSLPLRFLIVSRKTHEISSAFQKLAKQIQMDSLHIDGNTEDIRSYIDTEMDIASEEDYREEVTLQLLERAQGNFLWVHLAVQIINSCHTRLAVAQALEDLPAGMEVLYGRMADSMRQQPNVSSRRLGLSILGWAACARRGLTVEELSDALDNQGLFDLHRTIVDLCGGFVVVDAEGKAAMIHETAREYLVRETFQDDDRPLSINRHETNDKLFQRCMRRLTDQDLRTRMTRKQPPALLHYAANSWFIHLALGSYKNPEILRVALKFLQSPHVLTWIQAVAAARELRTLIVASRYLTDLVLKLRRIEDESLEQVPAISVFEGWATDLTKIVGKFGRTLTQTSDSIHKLIPPFCPQSSAIYQQFGRREANALRISGFADSEWDDCLARLSQDNGSVASAVLSVGNRIAVLANTKNICCIVIYDAATFEEQRRITHPERVLRIQTNKLGNLLVSYGYLTTRVWDLATGESIETVKNPPKRPRPHTLAFVEDGKTVMVASEDRCIRSFGLGVNAKKWETRAQIEEEVMDDAVVNFPMCSAISPDGTMIAYGYRAHPVTVWGVEPPSLLGQCAIALNKTDRTIHETAYGEVFDLAWHPFSGEVFALTQTGLLFRWDPYEYEASVKTESGADYMTISQEGSLIATGNGLGTLKIFQSSDLTQLYELSTQDPILNFCFSADSRRIYDVRGTYANVWEPSILASLAERSEYPDHNSDAWTETESLAKVSIQAEHHSARVDRVITLAGQAVGSLYCYGTEEGVAVLCEVGQGRIAEVERVTSFMSIEQVVWSEDGHLLAMSDLSGKLSIKRMTRPGDTREPWTVEHDFSCVIPPHKGHISQLLFDSTGDRIVAATQATLYAVHLGTKGQFQVDLSVEIGEEIKWMCHPTLSDYLVGLGPDKIHVLLWEDLSEVDTYSYLPVDSFSGMMDAGRRLTRVISRMDSSSVLLKLEAPGLPMKHEYALFDLSAVVPFSGTAPSAVTRSVRYSLLPDEVALRIREPLGFASRRRLVFLGLDRWVCTWRLPTPGLTASGRRASAQAGTGGVERHYFIPEDWVTAGEGGLCSSMPDGTLLCPRNGEVASVQCAKLRR